MVRSLMSANEIRQSFIDFFREKEHTYVHSSPCIAIDDPTLMFTNAGMNQFKDIFLGVEQRSYTRAVNSQKCIRVSGKHNDLEEVGKDGSHHTFFEMLGNWSFGDYYKEEAISWAWELLTQKWQVPKDKLYATIYHDDDEAGERWKKVTDIDPAHILKFGKKENFWEMGDTGPCGPCSEIHYDRGEQYSCGKNCSVNCTCGRFIELWNLVFIQYDRKADGSLEPLEKKHVDTGMGLERITAVLNSKDENYDTDLFQPIFRSISEITGCALTKANRTSFRVIADHIRMLTFSICDGATPSNEARGYVVRRILRRAVRFSSLLKEGDPVLFRLVDTVINIMGDFFPELKENPDYLKGVIRTEEEKFQRTLKQGNDLFAKITVHMQRGDTIAGKDIFALYDTYGFPSDLVNLMAGERGLKTDMHGFSKEMDKQKERSRAGAKDHARLPDNINIALTEFIGYDSLHTQTSTTWSGPDSIATATTVFYGESGGQKGDKGIIKSDDFEFKVEDTQKEQGVVVHSGKYIKGEPPQPDAEVILEVDENIRKARQSNHSATHLLHYALREQFGAQVKQQGSMVDTEKFTFDFTFPRKIKNDEIATIEDKVNELIQDGLEVKTYYKSLDEAKQDGIIALFDEKYGEKVRVVDMGNGLSRELCGGTQVRNTSEIKLFKVLSEEAISAGNRRITGCTGEYVEEELKKSEKILRTIENILKDAGFVFCSADISGSNVIALIRNAEGLLKEISSITDSPISMLCGKIKTLAARNNELQSKTGSDREDRECKNTVDAVSLIVKQNKQLEKDLEKLEQGKAAGEMDGILSGAFMVRDVSAAGCFFGERDPGYLDNVISALQEKDPDGIFVIAGQSKGRAVLLCAVGKKAQEQGFSAGDIVKKIGKDTGGGGGGSRSFARGGGGDPQKTEQIIASLQEFLTEQAK